MTLDPMILQIASWAAYLSAAGTVLTLLTGILSYQTLWPGIIMHWLVNASVNIKLIGVDSYQETLSIWGIAAAVTIPLALLSLYWVWKLPVRDPSPIKADTVPAAI